MISHMTILDEFAKCDAIGKERAITGQALRLGYNVFVSPNIDARRGKASGVTMMNDKEYNDIRIPILSTGNPNPPFGTAVYVYTEYIASKEKLAIHK